MGDGAPLLEDPVADWFHRLKESALGGLSDDEEDDEDAGVGAEKPPPLILVAVGKCGVGKSAFCNQICGRQIFESRRGAASVTHHVQIETLDCCLAAGGSPVCVVDTIGFGDPTNGPDLTQTALREQLEELEALADEILEGACRWCVLLCFSLNARFTEDDLSTLRQLQDVFGRQFWRKSVVVWTHSDTLTETSLEGYLEGLDDGMKLFVEASGASLRVDNTLPVASREYHHQMALLFRHVRSVAGVRPKTTGKVARKQRQAKFYSRTQRLDIEKKEEIESFRRPLSTCEQLQEDCSVM